MATALLHKNRGAPSDSPNIIIAMIRVHDADYGNAGDGIIELSVIVNDDDDDNDDVDIDNDVPINDCDN